MRTNQPWILPAAATLLLAACGGGGGDPPPPPPPTTVAVAAANGHLLTETHSWSTTGTGSDGVNYKFTLTTSPLQATAFPATGTMAARSLQTFTIEAQGVAATGAQTFYFDPATLAFVGTEYADGSCAITTTDTPLPGSAAVGASGPSFRQTRHAVCSSNASVTGTFANDWSLVREGATTLLCWTLTAQPAGGTPATLAECVGVAGDGVLGPEARITLSGDGMSIVTRNY